MLNHRKKIRHEAQKLPVAARSDFILVKATKGIIHRYIKGDTNDCFIFDSVFYSKELAEYAMEVGANIIGMVKTNKKDYKRRTLRILQGIYQEVITLCLGASLWYLGAGH